jgi:WD40 repeat protein/tRNA A-37 threonylcarbamoyl transferase component Bud32
MSSSPSPASELEKAWALGTGPDLAPFLDRFADLSPRDILDAARIDQRWRWKRGEESLSETYLIRFPGLRDHSELALELIYGEFVLREEMGDGPGWDEYTRRFPEFADRLRLQFEFVAALRASLGAHTVIDERPVASRGEYPSIPGYEVIEELGRGGMGIVYKARHEKLARIVALKLISREAGEEQRRRFQIEAEAVARLQHPGVVQVFEIGEHLGRQFLSLEYCQDGSLEKKLVAGPLPPDESARTVEQIARAIHASHQHQIIHRDLKPSNILLQATTTGILYKVTDFGLARQLDSGHGHSRTGDIMGTPSYMSPEQALGRVREIGPQADVYSLGAILYECLTGRPPFLGSSLLDTLDLVRRQSPVPVRQIQPKVPRDLETICLKCLEKEPARRFRTALELAEELCRFLDHEPIKSRPLGPIGRLARWCRRRPGLALLAASLLLALATAVATSIAFGVTQRLAYDNELAHSQQLLAKQQEILTANESLNRLSAGLALERGQTLCGQGRVAHGLLVIAGALELAPEADSHLQRRIRTNLALWSAERFRPQNATKLNPTPHRPQQMGRAILTVDSISENRSTFRLWDLTSGKALAPQVVQPQWTAGFLGTDATSALFVQQMGGGQLWDIMTGERLGVPLKLPNEMVMDPDGRGASMTSHGGVQRAIISHDRQRVITVSSSKVLLWNPLSGQEMARLLPDNRGLQAISFSADSQWIAIAGQESQVLLWDATTGRVVGSPLKHEGQVVQLSFSPDSRTLISVESSGRLRFWDVNSAQVRGETVTLDGRVTALTFSPDSRLVLAASSDHSAVLIDSATGRLTTSPWHHSSEVDRIAFSDDSRFCVTWCRDGVGQVWEVPRGRLINGHVGHPDFLTALAFGPDGSTLHTLNQNGVLRTWQRPIPIRSQTLDGFGVESASFSPDGRLIHGRSGDLNPVWDATSGTLLSLPDLHWGSVLSSQFSSDGRYLLTGLRNGSVRLWDLNTLQAKGPTIHHGSAVTLVAFSPDDRLAVTAGDNQIVQVWDLKTGSPHGPPIPKQKIVSWVQLSQDSSTMLIVPRDGLTTFWEVASARQIKIHGLLKPDRQGVRPSGSSLKLLTLHSAVELRAGETLKGIPSVWEPIAWSRDGHYAALGSTNPTISSRTARLFHASTGKMIAELQHQDQVHRLQFHSTSNLLVTGSKDSTARLWNPTTGTQIGEEMRHADKVTCVAFSPDGWTVLTGCWDGTARYWDVPSGKPLGPPLVHDHPVLDVAWSPDGRVVLTTSNGVLRTWPAPTPRSGSPADIVRDVRRCTGLKLNDAGNIIVVEP